MQNIYEAKNLKGLKKETLDSLNKLGKIESYKKGEYLFFNKDEVKDVYFILEGKITLYRYTVKGKKRIVYILDESEFINEVIFDELPSSINAEAFENAKIIRFNAKELKKIMATDCTLAEIIINSMGRKIRRLYRQIKNTVPIGLDRKVAAKLWKLSKDYGEPIKNSEKTNWKYVNLKISITYLADMLGSSREAVSREIKKLEKKDLIKWSKNNLFVNEKEIGEFFKSN